MNDPNHTPRPWRRNISATRVYSGADIEICLVNDALTPEERVSNANLIAASPDLLAACEFLLSDLTESQKFGARQKRNAIAKLAKAIAKAKGE